MKNWYHVYTDQNDHNNQYYDGIVVQKCLECSKSADTQIISSFIFKINKQQIKLLFVCINIISDVHILNVNMTNILSSIYEMFKK